MDFLIPDYRLTSSVTDGAELSATAHLTAQPRYSGEQVLLFEVDSNLRLNSVKDEKRRNLVFHQAAERKEHSQSSGDYVAVTPAGLRSKGRARHLISSTAENAWFTSMEAQTTSARVLGGIPPSSCPARESRMRRSAQILIALFTVPRNISWCHRPQDF
jgi:hypothetical protein